MKYTVFFLQNKGDDNTTMENGEKNETVSRFADETSNWTSNHSKSEGKAAHDKENSTVQSETIVQQGQSSNKASSNTSESMDEEDSVYNTAEDEDEEIQYNSRSLVGNVIHVKSLENFYFQAYDADIHL